MIHELEQEAKQPDGKYVQDSVTGDVMLKPTRQSIASDPRKRKKPMRELYSNERRNKNVQRLKNNAVPSITQMTKLQNDGVNLSFEKDGELLVANTRVNGVFKCGFCYMPGHKITNCQKLAKHRTSAKTCSLTMKNQAEMDCFKERMKSVVWVRHVRECPSILGTCDSDLAKSHFILNEIAVGSSYKKGDISTMQYNVTFIERNGGGEGRTEWITGKLFESLITHKYKKEKFVFDRTIYKKDG